MLDRKHPRDILDYSFTKIFRPNFKLAIDLALHLSKPTIPTTILI